jgi:hypothetical protein
MGHQWGQFDGTTSVQEAKAAMRPVPRTLAAAAVTAAIVLAGGGFAAAETYTLVGASQFDEDHAFTKTMRKFEALVQQYYEGPDEVEFERHLNSEPGLSTFSQMAPLMDATERA